MKDLAVVDCVVVAGSAVVRVRGEIDLSNALDVQESIGRAAPVDAVEVVVDLSGTTYLDSTGIAMLFRLRERLEHGRQELQLVVPVDSPIRRVLELTQLTRVIPVRDSLA
jgi:anti-anti-sigma factor